MVSQDDTKLEQVEILHCLVKLLAGNGSIALCLELVCRHDGLGVACVKVL